MKIKSMQTSKGIIHQFHCPGCKTDHAVDGGWTYNGNPDAPTFKPSILYREYDDSKEVHPKGVFVCHSYVTDGKIQFLGDCDHALKGQTVELPDFKERSNADRN